MKKTFGERLSSLIFIILVAGTAALYLWVHPDILSSPSQQEGQNGAPQTQVHTPPSVSGSQLIELVKPNNYDAATNETSLGETASGPADTKPVLEVSDDTKPKPAMPALPKDSYLRVDFVDVGQADFIVVECDGEFMTIDGGNVADSQLVYSFLKGRSAKRIKNVVITHAHEDHCGGVSAILANFEVGTVYSPVTEYDTKTFQKLAGKVAEKGLSFTVPKAGDTFEVGSAVCRIIGPVRSDYADVNDTSIVIRLQYGDTSFLFTGDAEETAEKDILFSGCDVSADVLKVGHHGSSTSTSYLWLRQVAPSYAVISSNKKEVPEYGHPHESTLSKLRDAEVKVFRTDIQGTITAVSDGRDITFTTERNYDADTLAS